jgi:DNA polymerase/3'-5' exonuclease PolX
MSKTAQKLPLKVAAPLAMKIQTAVADVCEQVAIVGSVRREKDFVGDIELLCVPRFEDPPTDLFGRVSGPAVSLLDQRLDQLKAEGRLKPGRGEGAKQKSYELGAFPGVQIELYICDAQCWGVHQAIRTGPAAFSKRLVTPRDHGGFLPAGHNVMDGFRLYLWGEFVPTRNEVEFFDAIGLDWSEPSKR